MVVAIAELVLFILLTPGSLWVASGTSRSEIDGEGKGGACFDRESTGFEGAFEGSTRHREPALLHEVLRQSLIDR